MSEHPTSKRSASELEHQEKRPHSAEPQDSSTSSSSRSPSPKRAHQSGVSHLLQTDAIPPMRPTNPPPSIPTESEPIYEVKRDVNCIDKTHFCRFEQLESKKKLKDRYQITCFCRLTCHNIQFTTFWTPLLK